VNLEAKVANYLQKVSAYPAEVAYFSAVFDVLLALNPPTTKIHGFACMKVLASIVITLKDGRIIGDNSSTMGTYEEIAEAISIVFETIESKAIMWKANYPVMLDDPAVSMAAKEITGRLKELDIVEHIESYLALE
jgi:hypothetical protein